MENKLYKKLVNGTFLEQIVLLIIYTVYMIVIYKCFKKSVERKEVKVDTPKDPYEEFDKMFE